MLKIPACANLASKMTPARLSEDSKKASLAEPLISFADFSLSMYGTFLSASQIGMRAACDMMSAFIEAWPFYVPKYVPAEIADDKQIVAEPQPAGPPSLKITQEDLPEITDLDILGTSLDRLPPHTLLVLLHSPFEDISEKALGEIARRGLREAISPLSLMARSAIAELKHAGQEKDNWVLREILAGRSDLGAIHADCDDFFLKEYFSHKSEVAKLYRKTNAILAIMADIAKRNNLVPSEDDRTGAKCNMEDGRLALRPIENFDIKRTQLGVLSRSLRPKVVWRDLRKVGLCVLEKERLMDLKQGRGPEPFFLFRKFDIFRNDRTGKLYFTSEYDVNHMFTMTACYLFYDLAGLPTRPSHIVRDQNNHPLLVRRYITDGVLFRDYSIRFSRELVFDEGWESVLRGSLLLDQIIGYTDRDDTNLFVTKRANGELVPVFVDMKFSLGEQKEGATSVIDGRLVTDRHPAYDFSKFVGLKVPEEFAYNDYHVKATREDMTRMAKRLAPITDRHLDQIVDVVERLLPEHTVDTVAVRNEWKRSLARAKELFL